MLKLTSRGLVLVTGFLALLLTTQFAGAAPATSEADVSRHANELAQAAADRFAHAVDHADLNAAKAECSLPWLNAFNETVTDAAGLQRSLELFTEFARRNPQAGMYYRGVVACLPFDQFLERQKSLAKDPSSHRKSLANLESLKLAASDRVVLVNWMNDYSILVRVRDGKATVAGLGPTFPQDAFLARLIADQRPYRQVRDVIYGRKYGAALTLDVLTPKRGANGAAVVYLLSGDFVSQPMPETDNWVLLPLLSRGYTVVTVIHSGIPKYTVGEIVRDAYRAVRFTRFHAHDYGINPDRIGVIGSSSGAYLSLMLATAGAKEPPLSDGTDPLGAVDEVDAISCKVQAAACFFPPTDWLNYGEKNKCVLDVNFSGPPVQSMLEFREFDNARFAFVPVNDRARIEQRLSDISPARRVTKDSAPTLIFHGEKDPTVPLQQSQLMMERLKAMRVPAELVVKQGAGHGWPDQNRDMDKVAQWFDQYLARRDKR